MKNFTIILGLVFFVINLFSQNTVEWSPNKKLNFSDFKSTASEINKSVNQIQVSIGSQIEFNYNMSRAEFMFTKNFNSKVKTIFHPNAAMIIAPDSSYANELLEFVNYSFNLTELYTRKLRKELFESKGVFSSSDFYKEAFDKTLNDLNVRNTIASKTSNFGHDKLKLKLLNQEVIDELNLLNEYCYSCKPKKKK